MSIVPSLYPPWDAALVHLDLTQNTSWGCKAQAWITVCYFFKLVGCFITTYAPSKLWKHPDFGPWEEPQSIWSVSEIRLHLTLEFYFHRSTNSQTPVCCRSPTSPNPDAWRAWCLGGTSEGLWSLGWMASSSAPFALPNSWAAWFLGKIPNFWYDST